MKMMRPTRPSPPPPRARPPPGRPDRPRTSSTCVGSSLAVLRNLIGVPAEECPPLGLRNRPGAAGDRIPGHEHALGLGCHLAVGREHKLPETDARPADPCDLGPHDDLADAVLDLSPVVDRRMGDDVREGLEVADRPAERVVARFVEIDVIDGVMEMSEAVEVGPARLDADLERAQAPHQKLAATTT